MVASSAVDGPVSVLNVDPRLEDFIEKIWLPGGPVASPVAVSLGRPPDGHLVAEQYAILPHPRVVRFLVPLASRKLAAASFQEYNATRAPLSRTIRGGLAAGFSVGLGGLTRLAPLTVSVDRRVPRGRWGDVLVTAHLASRLGLAEVHAFVAVRQVNPNAKPTLQLFDRAAVPVGFAKLGTTPATRALVRNEAAALARVAGRLGPVIVPELLVEGAWHDTRYIVVGPLPRDTSRWTGGVAATTETMRQVIGSGEQSFTTISVSSYMVRLRAELNAVSGQQELVAPLSAWLGAMERCGTSIPFGGSHGDWMPDNLGRSQHRVAVWDWEHSTAQAPVGFDLLHWHFHQAMVTNGLYAAVVAVRSAAPQLVTLGVPAEATGLVASLYLLDMCVRRTRLAAGGGGWNARWYPDILAVTRARGGGDHTAPG